MQLPNLTPSAQRGAGLVGTLTSMALFATLIATTLPIMGSLQREAALERAARNVAGLIVRARSLALVRGRATALVFERHASGWRCFLARDGDGDGVHRDDIRRGRDFIDGEVLQLSSGRAGPGILAGLPVPDPSGRGRLRGDPGDPIRAGRGDIVTLSPAGTATPGSIYFCDGRSRMRVIRIYGGTARIRQMIWHRGWRRWKKAGW
ncbi:MAG: hypothetical protein GXP47_14175 [Acidobacteria bacterium]|nr:hypothetical protein [Acidobacteriota bacterium]